MREERGSVSTAKILLVGPYPPPFGGISVHVQNAHTMMRDSGIRSAVLNTERQVPFKRVRFLASLFFHVVRGWSLHVHTNGHNRKSWLLAALSGLAAFPAAGAVLTLHSGCLPSYLLRGGWGRRAFARASCLLYKRVICVSQEIAETIQGLGVAHQRLEVRPAYLPMPVARIAVPESIGSWLRDKDPLMSTVLSFSPEYGFDVLVEAVKRLRLKYRTLGCLVIGGREQKASAEEAVRTAGLSDQILLCGETAHDLCLSLMARSDVFVRPTYHDGDAISVREALSLGVPVVASRVGSRPSGIHLFEAGNVEEFVGAMEGLWQNR